jgi:hypothetical protein
VKGIGQICMKKKRELDKDRNGIKERKKEGEGLRY